MEGAGGYVVSHYRDSRNTKSGLAQHEIGDGA